MAISEIGREIQRRMKENNWSAAELTRRAGTGRTCIPDILSGKVANPRVDNLEKIANAFNCSIDDLQKKYKITSDGNILITDKDLAEREMRLQKRNKMDCIFKSLSDESMDIIIKIASALEEKERAQDCSNGLLPRRLYESDADASD